MDFAQNPLKLVDSKPSETAEFWFNEYASLIAKHQSNDIPSLNTNFKPFENGNPKLIKFRGLVSDQLNPEYYLQSVQRDKDTTICGNFRENLPSLDNSSSSGGAANHSINFGDPNTVTNQRYPMIVRSVPYENQWVNSDTTNQSSDNNENEQSNGDNIVPNAPKGVERCMAKFYAHSGSIKVADLVEMYGVCYTPSVEAQMSSTQGKAGKDELKSIEEESNEDCDVTMTDNTNDSNDKTDKNDNNEVNPFKIMPIIHVLYWKKLDSETAIDKEIRTEMSENIDDIRPQLVAYIASFFGGDLVAAEYVLLNMISRVSSRKNGIMIGNFALGIENLPTDNPQLTERMAAGIELLYSQLLPRSKRVDISIKELNNHRWTPVKNHATQELEVNPIFSLQMAKGSHLILNQTALATGKLDKTGLLNLRSIRELIEDQKVTYDFEFHGLPFTTDIAVLMLTGKKINLGYSPQIYLRLQMDNTEQSMDSQSKPPSEEELQLWRKYIGIARAMVDTFNLSQPLCKAVEEDFVECRKKDKNATEETLHFRLNLTRLINASWLSEEVSLKILKQMQSLEEVRSQRDINAAAASPQQ